MKRNFEQYYSLDYISNAFYADISEAKVKEINRNYIVPMLKLYDHYTISGDMQRQEWMRRELVAVSKDTEEEEDVKKHLDKK
jgi:hypothetical protein